MGCIRKKNELLLEHHWSQLIEAFKKLIISDFDAVDLGRNVGPNIYNELPISDSNLDVNTVLKLLLHLIEMKPEQAASELNDRLFIQRLLARDYCVAQVNIIQLIVRKSDVKCFEMVMSLIHFRMGWLDIFDVIGALHVFNGLFAVANDDLVTEKLNTKCLQTHVEKIIQQMSYYQLTKVSILLLADLCKNNFLVLSWLRTNCFSQMEQIVD